MSSLSNNKTNESNTIVSYMDDSIFDRPINLLDLDQPYKVSFWITNLPYFSSYIQYISSSSSSSKHDKHTKDHHYNLNTKQQSQSRSLLNLDIAPSETLIYSVNKSDLVITEQIGKMFYENQISGHIINSNHNFNKNDYHNLLKCYKEIIDINDDYVEYIWNMIHKSQNYYNYDKDKNENKDDNRNIDKNWIKSDSFRLYEMNINDIKKKCRITSINSHFTKQKSWINDDALNDDDIYEHGFHGQHHYKSSSPPPPINPTFNMSPPPSMPPNLLHLYGLSGGKGGNGSNHNNNSNKKQLSARHLFLSNTSEEHFDLIAAVE